MVPPIPNLSVLLRSGRGDFRGGNDRVPPRTGPLSVPGLFPFPTIAGRGPGGLSAFFQPAGRGIETKLKVKMKIGILCHDSCGGSTRIAVCEACELARKGHEVHLFSKTTPFIHVTATAGLFQHTLSRTCLKSNRSSLEVVWPEDEMESMVRLISDVVSAKGLQVLHVHYALPLAYIALEVKTRLPRPGPALV